MHNALRLLPVFINPTDFPLPGFESVFFQLVSDRAFVLSKPGLRRDGHLIQDVVGGHRICEVRLVFVVVSTAFVLQDIFIRRVPRGTTWLLFSFVLQDIFIRRVPGGSTWLLFSFVLQDIFIRRVPGGSTWEID